jgi:hypothetical protein
MPTVNAISLAVIRLFSSFSTSTSAQWSFVHYVKGQPDCSSSSTVVLLRLNLSIHSYTFFCAMQCSPYYANILLQISDVLMLFGHKKWTTAHCSTTVQFKSGATIFKEDL